MLEAWLFPVSSGEQLIINALFLQGNSFEIVSPTTILVHLTLITGCMDAESLMKISKETSTLICWHTEKTIGWLQSLLLMHKTSANGLSPSLLYPIVQDQSNPFHSLMLFYIHRFVKHESF